jgi:two-component system response regulator GlrR
MRLCERPHAAVSTVSLFKEGGSLKQMVGQSPKLLKLTKMVAKVARCDASVLISGETGTGKEIVAQAIHALSQRKNKPFVPVNCGAIPPDLMENELFGHEPGAFTGALSSSAGVIHDAEGGTLFLDEIDSLPLQSQVKLLRFLQEKEYRPLGSRRTVHANVRVISASNANFDKGVRSGMFRADLYYRLQVMPLFIPSLRERKEDIPILARHLVAKYSAENNLSPMPLSSQALHKLISYSWPGNVRELENVLERAVILSESSCIDAGDIDLPVIQEAVDQGSFKTLKAKAVKEFETEYLQKLLVLNEGNVAKAAQAAGKHRRAFLELLHKHRIDVRKRIPPNIGE